MTGRTSTDKGPITEHEAELEQRCLQFLNAQTKAEIGLDLANRRERDEESRIMGLAKDLREGTGNNLEGNLQMSLQVGRTYELMREKNEEQVLEWSRFAYSSAMKYLNSIVNTREMWLSRLDANIHLRLAQISEQLFGVVNSEHKKTKYSQTHVLQLLHAVEAQFYERFQHSCETNYKGTFARVQSLIYSDDASPYYKALQRNPAIMELYANVKRVVDSESLRKSPGK